MDKNLVYHHFTGHLPPDDPRLDLDIQLVICSIFILLPHHSVYIVQFNTHTNAADENQTLFLDAILQ